MKAPPRLDKPHDAYAALRLPNFRHGVDVNFDASDNLIGGSNAGTGYATRLVTTPESTDANPMLQLRNSPSGANPLTPAGQP